MDYSQYSRIGRATELTGRDRFIYRWLEILPGLLSWGTLAAIIVLSFTNPDWMAIFIIAFDIYWLFKTIFLSLHMRMSFNKMKANLKRNWTEELNKLPWQDLRHLVILPMYQESLEVVRASFLSLASISYPLDKMIAVLAIEERGGQEALDTAKAIEKEFGNNFFKFLITFFTSSPKPG